MDMSKKFRLLAWLVPFLTLGCTNGSGGGAVTTTVPTVSSTNPIDTAAGVHINRKITALSVSRLRLQAAPLQTLL
jgi:hypothetical protein